MLNELTLFGVGFMMGLLIKEFIKNEIRDLGIQTDINTWSVEAEEDEEESSEVRGWWMFN